MAKVPAGQWIYSPIDIKPYCRNWVQDTESSQRRMGNKSEIIRGLGQRVNYLLGRSPRVIFQKQWPHGLADTSGLDPLFRWLYLDNVVNAREYFVSIVAAPRVAGSNSYYAQQWDGADNYAAGNITISRDITSGGVTYYTDIFQDGFIVSRGAAAAANIEDGLSSFNGMTILGITVQDRPLTEFDTTDHIYCKTDAPNGGDEILDDRVEEYRSNLHSIRTTNLPVLFTWSAIGTAGTAAEPGDENGLTVSSTTDDNLFDRSITFNAGADRTAHTPGFIFDVDYAGVGNRTLTAGKDLLIEVAVLANATTNDGTVTLQGPAHAATNWTEVTVTGGGGLAWYSGAARIKGNTAIGPTDVTTACNKVDVFGRVSTSGTMYVYGIVGFAYYG